MVKSTLGSRDVFKTRNVTTATLDSAPVTPKITYLMVVSLNNRPFYRCLLGDLATEWQRGWR